jgi:hypothetical protein
MLIRTIAVPVLAIAASIGAAAAAEEGSSEPAACAALTGRDAEIVARLPREYIEDVSRLVDAPVPPLSATDRASWDEKTVLRGATIAVRPVEGLSLERLHRLVRCGLSRAAAADPARPTDWPRTPPATTLEVYSGGERFIVMLQSPDPAVAEAIWQSARELKPKTALGSR